jgi:hypothetical protein
VIRSTRIELVICGRRAFCGDKARVVPRETQIPQERASELFIILILVVGSIHFRLFLIALVNFRQSEIGSLPAG